MAESHDERLVCVISAVGKHGTSTTALPLLPLHAACHMNVPVQQAEGNAACLRKLKTVTNMREVAVRGLHGGVVCKISKQNLKCGERIQRRVPGWRTFVEEVIIGNVVRDGPHTRRPGERIENTRVVEKLMTRRQTATGDGALEVWHEVVRCCEQTVETLRAGDEAEEKKTGDQRCKRNQFLARPDLLSHPSDQRRQ